jgi:hypothetical protein
MPCAPGAVDHHKENLSIEHHRETDPWPKTEHPMRTFQGTFRASPDYALWYGWSEMQRDLTEIEELSAQMRREH